MASYSVAEAKNTLPRLIDRAIAGEEVIITRHGKIVAEVRAKTVFDRDAWLASLAQNRLLRDSLPPMKTPTAELLRELYDEKPW